MRMGWECWIQCGNLKYYTLDRSTSRRWTYTLHLCWKHIWILFCWFLSKHGLVHELLFFSESLLLGLPFQAVPPIWQLGCCTKLLIRFMWSMSTPTGSDPGFGYYAGTKLSPTPPHGIQWWKFKSTTLRTTLSGQFDSLDKLGQFCVVEHQHLHSWKLSTLCILYHLLKMRNVDILYYLFDCAYL